jgi:thiol-disulfide isomerase/thioredoxin
MKMISRLGSQLPHTLGLLVVVFGLTACGSKSPAYPNSLDTTGDWTFVNYWAEWCKPCIKEIPELNQLHLRSGVRVLGVNYDGAIGDDLQTQLDRLGVAFPTLGTDPAARYGTDRPQVLPTTLVIDPRGQLREILVGPQTEASLLAAAGLDDSVPGEKLLSTGQQ